MSPFSSPYPVFDGHNDTLVQLHLSPRAAGRSFFERTTSARGHLDLPRARAGGMIGGLYAIWIPPDPEAPNQKTTVSTDDGWAVELADPLDFGYANRFAWDTVRRVQTLVSDSAGGVVLATSVQDVQEAIEGGAHAAVLHIEGADPLDEDLDELHRLYDAGLRSVGLTWSRPNRFAHGVPFRYPSTPDIGPGLTEAGKRLVTACSAKGLLLDLAHLNEQGFWDVESITDRPLVVSHAGVHAIAPTSRNLTDKQIDAVAASGGLVGITFYVGDLRPDGKTEADTPLDLIARHARYVADRVGVEHVAFGSDFDGAMVPAALDDAAGYPRVFEALRNAGFTDEDLRQVGTGNWLRVLGASLRSGGG
ncbi:MAG: dipeptidase [Bacteroidota bacterium]